MIKIRSQECLVIFVIDSLIKPSRCTWFYTRASSSTLGMSDFKMRRRIEDAFCISEFKKSLSVLFPTEFRKENFVVLSQEKKKVRKVVSRGGKFIPWPVSQHTDLLPHMLFSLHPKKRRKRKKYIYFTFGEMYVNLHCFDSPQTDFPTNPSFWS